MQIGRIVDYCIAYNERRKESEPEIEKDSKRPKARKRRMATQAEIDAFLG